MLAKVYPSCQLGANEGPARSLDPSIAQTSTDRAARTMDFAYDTNNYAKSIIRAARYIDVCMDDGSIILAS